MARRLLKKVAVVGAGPCGLIAVKCCKEEGLDVVCFEKTDNYGGSWNYRYEPVECVGFIRKSTVSLYSKEMNAFSDYPPPENLPNYLNYENMMDYIDSYAEHNELLPHVRLEHEVVQLVPVQDFDRTGQWVVKTKSPEQQTTEEIFDGVIVCTGRKGYPHLPSFPNQELFQGKVLHSKFLRTTSDFDNKTVLIIGFGNSAVEAAVEISPLAKQVYLSTRSGGWVVPRVGRNGLPSDIQFFRRNIHLVQKLRYKKFCQYVEDKLNHVFDHDDYKIRPNYAILAKHPVISDDFPDKVLTGRVLLKGNVLRFAQDGVVFEDEDFVTKVDGVIYATGYESKLPFLENHVYGSAGGEPNLYKFLFPLTMKHGTLALVGLVDPMGPNIPVWESQCRLVARVLSNAVQLPSQECMALEMRKTKEQLSQRFVASPNGRQPVDYMEYMDELAAMAGFKANLSALFAKRPALVTACFLGPCLPYQYRLEGPHSWSGAQQAILKCKERVVYPLSGSRFPKTLPLKAAATSGWISMSLLSIFICFIINSRYFV